MAEYQFVYIWTGVDVGCLIGRGEKIKKAIEASKMALLKNIRIPLDKALSFDTVSYSELFWMTYQL